MINCECVLPVETTKALEKPVLKIMTWQSELNPDFNSSFIINH
jgi:hypothetical protein